MIPAAGPCAQGTGCSRRIHAGKTDAFSEPPGNPLVLGGLAKSVTVEQRVRALSGSPPGEIAVEKVDLPVEKTAVLVRVPWVRILPPPPEHISLYMPMSYLNTIILGVYCQE